MERGQILDKAKAIINGERTQQYGEPENCFRTIAGFWNVYMFARGNNIVTDKDTAIMQALMKIAREAHGAGKEDNIIDACGYLALAADMS